MHTLAYNKELKLLQFSIICCSNDMDEANRKLLSSPDINNHDLQVIFDPETIPKGYNQGLKEATGEYIIFVHHDVILPQGFFVNLEKQIDNLKDKDWGVIGPAGVDKRDFYGNIYDACKHSGDPSKLPHDVDTLDEFLFVIKRDTLTFDENLPSKNHFHCADLCMQSRSEGLSVISVDVYCLHLTSHLNDGKKGESYKKAYFYMQDKWRSFLPFRTTTIMVTEEESLKFYPRINCLCMNPKEQ